MISDLLRNRGGVVRNITDNSIVFSSRRSLGVFPGIPEASPGSVGCNTKDKLDNGYCMVLPSPIVLQFIRSP